MGPLRGLLERRLEARAERLARWLVPHLPPGARLLDIGSGTGHNAVALRRLSGGTCVEVDVVDFHLAGEGPLLFDGERLPIAEERVDVGLLIHVLSFAGRPATLLREAGRVASRGVVVIQTVYHGLHGRLFLRFRGWLLGRGAFRACRALGLIPWAPDPLAVRRRFSPGELESIVRDAGLVLLRAESKGGFASLTSRTLLVLARPPEAEGDNRGAVACHTK